MTFLAIPDSGFVVYYVRIRSAIENKFIHSFIHDVLKNIMLMWEIPVARVCHEELELFVKVYNCTFNHTSSIEDTHD